MKQYMIIGVLTVEHPYIDSLTISHDVNTQAYSAIWVYRSSVHILKPCTPLQDHLYFHVYGMLYSWDRRNINSTLAPRRWHSSVTLQLILRAYVTWFVCFGFCMLNRSSGHSLTLLLSILTLFSAGWEETYWRSRRVRSMVRCVESKWHIVCVTCHWWCYL